MKIQKILFTTIFLLWGSNTSAFTCADLSKIADKNSIQYGTKYSFVVKGQKDSRTYFHSAPSSQCKIKQLFLIPKDSVVAYQEFENEKETWLYVMYFGKNGDITEGWMLEKSFKISGYLSP